MPKIGHTIKKQTKVENQLGVAIYPPEDIKSRTLRIPNTALCHTGQRGCIQ